MEINELEIKLEELANKIKNSKSFKSNQSIKESFTPIWIEYAEKTSFSEKAMNYYYDCFKIDWALPLYSYLQKNTIGKEVFTKFLSLRFDTYHPHFPMCLNLLAHLINNQNSNYDYFEKTLIFLPHNFKNREGNINGNAVKDFNKYFLETLNPDLPLPAFSKMNLNKMQLNKVGKMFIYCLENIQSENKEEKEIKKIQNLMDWSKSIITEVEEDTRKNIIDERPKTVSEKLEDAFNYIKKQKDTIKSLSDTVEFQKEKIISEANDKTKILNELRNSQNLNTTLSYDKQKLQEKINELENIIKNLHEEFESEKKLNKNVAGNNQKQLDAFFYKLSENLKFEYEDFKDALDADMSISLGENMRTQLGNVFKILSDSGIKLE